MRALNHILCMTLAALLMPLMPFMPSDCGASAAKRRQAGPAHVSFRNIPGVTGGEIRAIEALQKDAADFVYGALPGADAFLDPYGEVAGYDALVCGWLTDLFGIPFKPVRYERNALLAGLASREIDFTGSLSAAEQPRESAFMTDPITERPLRYMRIAGGPRFAEIAALRPLRFVFLKDAATADAIAARTQYSFTKIFSNTVAEAYDLLKSGQADAVFTTCGSTAAAFDAYGDVVAADYFPLIYHQLSLSTRNPALSPLISVVQKALRNGAVDHLAALYARGRQEYLQHKLFQQLNQEEKTYLRTRHVVRFAAEHANYPISFYNAYEQQWQGIAVDLLTRVEGLTGLRFDRVNDQEMERPALLQTLASGKASMLTAMLRSHEMEDRFIWSKAALLSDHYALLSKAGMRGISMGEVWKVKVGLTKDSAYAEMFRAWFPKHAHTVEYEDTDTAFAALVRGDVDLVMSSQRRLLALTHYYELTGFKANIVFDFAAQSRFGFNRDEAVLCAIVDKALAMIDVQDIATHWTQSTYDYQGKLARAQRPWLIGAAALLICVLILLCVLFQKTRHQGKKLESLIQERTAELHDQHMLMCLINDAAVLLLEAKTEDYPGTLKRSMELFCWRLQAERVYLWQNIRKGDGRLYYRVVCYWADKGAQPLKEEEFAYQDTLPGWEERFFRGEVLNSPVDSLPASMRMFFAVNQLQSVLAIPLFLKGDFWGFVSLDDCRRRRVFPESEEYALRAWGLLAVNAMQRGELVRSMRQTLTKLEAVINNYKGVIWSVDDAGVITTFNGQYLKVLGIEPSYMEGQKLESARLETGHLDIVDNVRKTFSEGPQDWMNEIDQGVFHSYTTLMHDDQGNITGVVGSTDDVTPMIRLQRELESAVKAAEVASRSKSVFLANMSHEIRTPMNAILGVTEIQLQDETLAPDIREAFGRIYSSGDMLLGIINDILDMSRIEAGKLDLAPAAYEVASLINDTVQLNVLRIGSKAITFELHVDEHTPAEVVGDVLRVKQILNNLLSNAFKYTTQGVIKLSVAHEVLDLPARESGEVAGLAPGEDPDVTLVFVVRDTGQGMTEQQTGRLFEAYTRFNLETNRSIEGSGLGMSITRDLVHMMAGEIAVESAPDRGTTVTVRLPQRDVGAGELGRNLADRLQQFRIHSLAHMKRVQIRREFMPYGSVLIVDDMESNLYVAKGLLAPYGLTVDTAGGGPEALGIIEQGKLYDIVFMDHMMPAMDGVEATKTLRDRGYTKPVVALTANAVAGQADMFRANGFDDFISKPIDLREMNAVLNKFVRDRHPPEVVEAARRLQDEAREAAAATETRESADPKLSKIFIRDASKALQALEDLCAKRDAFSDEEIRGYVINVHGMKSSLANIGEAELSARAAGLEKAGRERDTAAMASRTPAFLNALRQVVANLTPGDEEDPGGTTDEDQAYLRERLLVLQAACAAHDKKTARDALTGINQKTWPRPIRERLDAIAEHLLHSKFKLITGVVDDMLAS